MQPDIYKVPLLLLKLAAPKDFGFLIGEVLRLDFCVLPSKLTKELPKIYPRFTQSTKHLPKAYRKFTHDLRKILCLPSKTYPKSTEDLP